MSVSPTLRVVAAQAESVPGDLDANVATAVALVEPTAGDGVEHGVVVAGAALRRAPAVTTLSLLVVEPDGKMSAPYDEQHLFSDERAFFSGGSAVYDPEDRPVTRTRLVAAGVADPQAPGR